ncbi:MAG: hypothetical protein AB7D36_03965 [Oscillospiraceae bacterium]
MQIQIKTGFFSYQPCELSLFGDWLLLRCADMDKKISVSALRGVTANKDLNGTYRLELTDGKETLEALVMGEDENKLYALFREIVNRHRKIEFRILCETVDMD